MEVILRENVKDLGQRGDVVRVADGFARNFLIPKQLAYRLTEGVRRQVETESRAKAAREAREAEQAGRIAAKIGDLQVIRFRRKAGESGSLYGSVTNVDIAEELAARGIEVDRRNVRLEEPIRRIGTHHVLIHVYRETDVTLAVEVEPEEESAGS
ncbi:MAG: 50S ribosomal protein L9 [Acidobacteriota bacterium]|nr:50S ribosomal protein L9 [Acidobacteriota bacterium]MDQ7088290.1 50S ribosomal protein L9 [Acidobacteriota bacterium]